VKFNCKKHIQHLFTKFICLLGDRVFAGLFTFLPKVGKQIFLLFRKSQICKFLNLICNHKSVKFRDVPVHKSQIRKFVIIICNLQFKLQIHKFSLCPSPQFCKEKRSDYDPHLHRFASNILLPT
jgi:hypothetical protein